MWWRSGSMQLAEGITKIGAEDRMRKHRKEWNAGFSRATLVHFSISKPKITHTADFRAASRV